MRLMYFKRDRGNFGDDLNAWLWPRVAPGFESSERAEWLVGIGTILDDRLFDLDGRKLICGSGFRPGTAVPPAPDDWSFLWVRGKVTAETFGLDVGLALGDPALLVAGQVESAKPGGGGAVGFMPHYRTTEVVDCATLCEQEGLVFIDPEAEVEQTLERFSQVERVICEAMHGAIVADALGKPWIRIRGRAWHSEGEEVSSFKWSDWASVFGVDPSPAMTLDLPVWARCGRRLIDPLLAGRRRASLREGLKWAAVSSEFRLSDASIRRSCIEQMREKLATL